MAIVFAIAALLPGPLQAHFIAAMFSVAFAGLWFRLRKVGVFADQSVVRIVNPVRTRALPWSEVRQFSVGAQSFYPRIGFAELKDGTRIRIMAIQGINPYLSRRNGEAEETIEELNIALSSHT